MFDDWVAKAPFRHLGVFALAILAIMTILIGGCAPEQHYRCDKFVTRTDVQYDYYLSGAVKTTKVTSLCVHSTFVVQY